MIVLAKKGSIHLVKYSEELYAVDKITKAVGMSYFASSDKLAVIESFREIAKKNRRSKDDFNLELYGL